MEGVKIEVKSGYTFVTATVEARRKMLGLECYLVRFGINNAQWMPYDDRNLIITELQRKEIKSIPLRIG